MEKYTWDKSFRFSLKHLIKGVLLEQMGTYSQCNPGEALMAHKQKMCKAGS